MNNKQKVLGEIFNNPTYHFHVRELARITQLNPNTIINISKVLEKENLIKRQEKKHIVEIFANIEQKDFIRQKRIFNLLQLYSSGLVDFLADFYKNPKAIVVIGSYSRGEDFEKSDIDLVIITEKKGIPELTKFEKKMKRKIHILPTNYRDISEEFYTNLINGVVLEGYLSRI